MAKSDCRDGWVYVMVASDGAIKVGHGIRPILRIKAHIHMEKCCGRREPRFVCGFEASMQVELAFHKAMSGLSIRGREWYPPSKKVIDGVVELCKRHNVNVDNLSWHGA